MSWGGQVEHGRVLLQDIRSQGNSQCPRGLCLQSVCSAAACDRSVKELKLQLNDLRIIRECESVIDRCYSEVITPKVQTESRWMTTMKGIDRACKNNLGPFPSTAGILLWTVLWGAL